MHLELETVMQKKHTQTPPHLSEFKFLIWTDYRKTFTLRENHYSDNNRILITWTKLPEYCTFVESICI